MAGLMPPSFLLKYSLALRLVIWHSCQVLTREGGVMNEKQRAMYEARARIVKALAEVHAECLTCKGGGVTGNLERGGSY